MTDIAWLLFLLFVFLVVLVPFILMVITGYETSASFHESLKRSGQGAQTGFFVIIGMNLGRAGLDWGQWYWDTLFGIPAGVALQLLVDWIAMRKEAKRTTI
jgi:hypothetical protein